MGKKKAVRNKRFTLKEPISLIMQTLSGEAVSGDVKDLSMRGISILVGKEKIESNAIQVNQVLPYSKFKAGEKEIALGRVVIKFLKDESEGLMNIGLMVIDTVVPIEGELARFIESDMSESLDPAQYELGPDDLSLGDFLGQSWEQRDIFIKARRYNLFHEEFKKSDRWGYYIPRTPSKGTRIRLGKPRSNGRDDFIIMASNDYLGLASHPEVIDATEKALRDYGFGSTGSAVTVGQTELHDQLEEKLSRIFRTESAILFNSGYAANVGTISGIVGPEDLVVADILSHASIYDGMMLSSGTKRFFKHNDVGHFERVLSRSREESNGALAVVEAVFSMDGDVAPLKEIRTIADRHHCRIMIDEAHSFGVLGPNGLGLAEEAGMLGGLDLTMGTFSKIAGGIGGFICGSRDIINWLRISARSAFFSVSLPPSTVAATNKALDIFLANPSLVHKLRENIAHFKRGLAEIGFSVNSDHRTAILPVVIGDEAKMAKMYRILYDAGVYTIPVIYPAVSKNNCRFRFTVSAMHTLSDIDYALLVLRRAIDMVGIDFNAAA